MNSTILCIFIVEAALKLYALRLTYFRDSWNIFDFGLLCITLSISVLEKFILPNIGSGDSSSNVGSKTSILRVFRLGRILRLVNRAASLRMIFNTFLITLPSLANIGILLFIVQFIFTILFV